MRQEAKRMTITLSEEMTYRLRAAYEHRENGRETIQQIVNRALITEIHARERVNGEPFYREARNG